MKSITGIAAIAVLTFSIFTTAQDALDPSPKCPCYTATSYVTNNGCPAFEPTSPCIIPLCILLSTTTIPGTNKRCPSTPTATSYLPCQTACPKGCATYTTTETHSSSCIPTFTSSFTHPNPSSLRPTRPISSLTTKVRLPSSTITKPPHSRPCYTETVSVSGRCPEDELGCPPPDCIWLSTTLVPPGSVDGCPITPTVTRSRTCLGRCDGSCATQWVTETATAW